MPNLPLAVGGGSRAHRRDTHKPYPYGGGVRGIGGRCPNPTPTNWGGGDTFRM